MMKNYSDLKVAVDAKAGVLTVSMATLRDIHGAGKLGTHVRAQILNDLVRHGLRADAIELPAYQHQLVRVYDPESPVGRVIEAVNVISLESDSTLRELVAADAHSKLERIKAIFA